MIGHLRLNAARKLQIREILAILSAQVKAFRLLVNRSANWADWDEDLLALELKDLDTADIDLSLTGSISTKSIYSPSARTIASRYSLHVEFSVRASFDGRPTATETERPGLSRSTFCQSVGLWRAC
jgi:hypothetical protein